MFRVPNRGEKVRVQESFERLPDGDLAPEIAVLEQLSPDALGALIWWARDEIAYAGTTYPVGLGIYEPTGARHEVLEAGLVKLLERGSRLYVLTEDGRRAATVLFSDDKPPEAVAEVVQRLRAEARRHAELV
jgi:hypothetical protein